MYGTAHVAYFMHAGQTASIFRNEELFFLLEKNGRRKKKKFFYGIDHNGGSVQGKKGEGKVRNDG